MSGILIAHVGQPDSFKHPTLSEFDEGTVGDLCIDYSGDSAELLDKAVVGESILVVSGHGAQTLLVAVASVESTASSVLSGQVDYAVLPVKVIVSFKDPAQLSKAAADQLHHSHYSLKRIS